MNKGGKVLLSYSIPRAAACAAVEKEELGPALVVPGINLEEGPNLDRRELTGGEGSGESVEVDGPARRNGGISERDVG